MSAGYISSREQAKGHQTRQNRVNSSIGTIPAEQRSALRAKIAAKRKPAFAPIPAERALVLVEQVNLLPAETRALVLFPPAASINGIIAYEQFRTLSRYLDDAIQTGCVEKANLMRERIQSYARQNQASGSTIWFRVHAFGSRVDIRHFVYDAASNRLERYWGRG